jgi:hypothetical protein
MTSAVGTSWGQYLLGNYSGWEARVESPLPASPATVGGGAGGRAAAPAKRDAGAMAVAVEASAGAAKRTRQAPENE